MNDVSDFERMIRDPVSRRAFLTRMSAAGLGAAAAALLAGCGSSNGNKAPLPPGSGGGGGNGGGGGVLDPTNFPGIPGRSEDEVVLNYALTLEILEADLYRQALNIASGRSVSQPLDATRPSGATGTGNYQLKVGAGGIASEFVTPAFLYLAQYAYVEAAHRDFLRAALQSLGAPTAQPNTKGYTAAFGSTLESILNLLYVVEETGVRAYLGAAGFMNDTQLLTTAVAIQSTEARHSGAIAYVLGKDAGPPYLSGDKNVLNRQQTPNPAPYAVNTFQYYLDPPTVLNSVKPFIVA